MAPVTAVADIISYAPELHEIFRQLNLDWLNEYDLVEDHDLLVLDDPQKIILDNGGHIFLAVCDGRIVGTSALMKAGEKIFELVKMSVTPAYRGKGISKILIEKCIGHARFNKAERIMLYSNHKLTTAIRLYESYGFRHIALKNSPFETADVQMELIL